METRENVPPTGSLVDPFYTSGDYFTSTDKHSEDAAFKTQNFIKLFRKVGERNGAIAEIKSYADVGCGSGAVVKLLSRSLRETGVDLQVVKGYDIAPHVQNLHHDDIEFRRQDFCQSTEEVDLVTLFDVFEHIPDPVQFIKQVSQRCRFIGFHIPLDHTLSLALRDAFRARLKHPGHLIFMDTADALNVLCLSGLRVLDYAYTFNYLSPGGHKTLLRKLMLPLRFTISSVSPWLLSKTLGGASLMVIAATPNAYQNAG
jgi:SAM-dependent methyltransferase